MKVMHKIIFIEVKQKKQGHGHQQAECIAYTTTASHDNMVESAKSGANSKMGLPRWKS
jgi:hypothetical protein